jgi:hypothetical protein
MRGLYFLLMLAVTLAIWIACISLIKYVLMIYAGISLSWLWALSPIWGPPILLIALIILALFIEVVTNNHHR